MTTSEPLASMAPYITRWSAEHAPPEPVIIRRGRLAYPQERLGDRDRHGVLWARAPLRRGQGRPEFGRLHPRRQRAAMTRLWCQVCGKTADRTSEGWLWLTSEDPHDRPNWPRPLETADPPLCAPCAVKAVQMCPRLRRRHTALRVRKLSEVAVRGSLHLPCHPRPIPVAPGAVYFSDPRARWILAGQLIVALQQFTVTTLDTEHPATAHTR